MSFFSWARFVAVLAKEFVQMRRDRLTFAMMVGVPIMQLILFGFAINSDPKHLPTAVLAADNSVFARSFLRAMENSEYFRIRRVVASRAEGERMLRLGEVQFFVTVPEDFSRKLQRGERPVLLIEADATDPAATSNAITALGYLNQNALTRDLQGSVQWLAQAPAPFEVRVHRLYNPEGLTETVGDSLGFVGRRVQGDLERFAQFMEDRGRATGGWQGEIHGQAVRRG